jgi:hypothetical protein
MMIDTAKYGKRDHGKITNQNLISEDQKNINEMQVNSKSYHCAAQLQYQLDKPVAPGDLAIAVEIRVKINIYRRPTISGTK